MRLRNPHRGTVAVRQPVLPLPPAERSLETVTAELVCIVDRGFNALEGTVFDEEGNLLFVSAPDCRVLKLSMETGAVEVVARIPKGAHPAGLDIAPDGRLFVACLGTPADGGFIAVVDRATASIEHLLFEGRGFHIDDVLFEGDGGFYMSDMAGSAQDPSGGVYHVRADLETVEPVFTRRVMANGIALSSDERTLWVTELGANTLWRLGLAEDRVSIEPYATARLYQFTGGNGCDSCTLDAAGNLYVALFGQGRFIVFAPNGVPFRQVVVPGRAEGRMLETTHIAMRPGTDELYLCTGDGQTGETAIYRAPGLCVEPARGA